MFERGIRRETHLYWGGRQAVDVYQEELVLEWMRRHPQLHFTAVLSEAGDMRPRMLGLADSAQPTGVQRDAWGGCMRRRSPIIRSSMRSTSTSQARRRWSRSSAAPIRRAARTRLYFDSFDYAPPATLTSTP